MIENDLHVCHCFYPWNDVCQFFYLTKNQIVCPPTDWDWNAILAFFMLTMIYYDNDTEL